MSDRPSILYEGARRVWIQPGDATMYTVLVTYDIDNRSLMMVFGDGYGHNLRGGYIHEPTEKYIVLAERLVEAAWAKSHLNEIIKSSRLYEKQARLFENTWTGSCAIIFGILASLSIKNSVDQEKFVKDGLELFEAIRFDEFRKVYNLLSRWV